MFALCRKRSLCCSSYGAAPEEDALRGEGGCPGGNGALTPVGTSLQQPGKGSEGLVCEGARPGPT